MKLSGGPAVATPPVDDGIFDFRQHVPVMRMVEQFFPFLYWRSTGE